MFHRLYKKGESEILPRKKHSIVYQETQDRIHFTTPLTVTNISRIFDYTNHIEILETFSFDQKALYVLQNAKGCVIIEQLELWWLNYDAEIRYVRRKPSKKKKKNYRKIVASILQKHKISKIMSSIDNDISNDNLSQFAYIMPISHNSFAGKLIRTISKNTSIIEFNVGDKEFLSEESKRSWKMFAKEIQENKNLLALKICAQDGYTNFPFCYINEPFFNSTAYFLKQTR